MRPVNGERDAFDAGLIPRLQIQRLDFIFLSFGPPRIHDRIIACLPTGWSSLPETTYPLYST